jgi:NAD(P)H dehydrogenase (quinone)
MNVFIIVAHPEPQSFNGALFRQSELVFRELGHPVQVSDLYAMGFNPVSGRHNFTTQKDSRIFKQQIEEMHATELGGFASDIEAELQKLERCDLMVCQFPLWWFGLPAILKGWADRVLAMGRTYGAGRFYKEGVFRGKRAMLSLTTGGPSEVYEKGGWNGDIEAILRPIQRGILEFVGFSILAPHIVYGPARKSDEERDRILDGYSARLRKIEAESPCDVGSY